jgi:hypothetical protein
MASSWQSQLAILPLQSEDCTGRPNARHLSDTQQNWMEAACGIVRPPYSLDLICSPSVLASAANSIGLIHLGASA